MVKTNGALIWVKMENPNPYKTVATDSLAGSVKIEYFTDPLCCWSWAMEPHLQQLRQQYPQIAVQYRMSGLIPAWGQYHDPINDVSRPAQMGPLWMEVKHTAQVPIKETIWFHDPPASSYPACIAVKSAGLQSQEAETALLAALRTAVMSEGINVAKWSEIKAIAKALEQQLPKFSAAQLMADIKGAGKDAFAKDLERKKLANISRTPSLIITQEGRRGVIVTGYRPYSELLRAVQQVCPQMAG